MNIAPLDPKARRLILHRLERVLRYCDPQACSPGQRTRPGGLDDLEPLLDRIVHAVRETAADQLEPYLFQFLECVCPGCPHQQVSGHCDLRRPKQCLLQRHAGVIITTIAQALKDIGDERYLTVHGLRQANPSR